MAVVGRKSTRSERPVRQVPTQGYTRNIMSPLIRGTFIHCSSHKRLEIFSDYLLGKLLLLLLQRQRLESSNRRGLIWDHNPLCALRRSRLSVSLYRKCCCRNSTAWVIHIAHLLRSPSACTSIPVSRQWPTPSSDAVAQRVCFQGGRTDGQ